MAVGHCFDVCTLHDSYYRFREDSKGGNSPVMDSTANHLVYSNAIERGAL